MKVQLLIGDCRDRLRDIPDQSTHCVVTSPPYFGLRDYGVDGQLGAEPTPQEFVAAITEVFREVWRVLRDDGTVWLNLGDSYNANGRIGHGSRIGYKQGTNRASATGTDHTRATDPTLKSKDLIGIPWRVAFALQADGWYLRQDIIWHKPNPMPESVRDRCTKAHEYVFLLSKNPKYYYDHEAAKEPAVKGAAGSSFHTGKSAVHQGNRSSTKGRKDSETRNRRSVWSVTTRPYKGAHFATFPPDLVEPCILAGCPEGGTVLDPFAGSGTTGYVADRLHRNAVLIEMNPEYTGLILKRMSDAGNPMYATTPEELSDGTATERH